MPFLILRRLGNMLLIMLAVSVVLFLLLEINGDSVAAKVLGAFSTDEQRRLWLEANGYNDPLYVRYFRWLSGFVTGNLGESITFQAPVAEVSPRPLPGSLTWLGYPSSPPSVKQPSRAIQNR